MIPDNSIVVSYGSRVYGTYNKESDYDYIAIVPNGSGETGTEHRIGNKNIHIYQNADFQEQLKNHKIHALEAYFSSSKVRDNFYFNLDLSKLRHELNRKRLLHRLEVFVPFVENIEFWYSNC